MSKKSWRSLITFVVLIALGAWYFSDTRTEEEKTGRVSVAPSS